MDQLKTPKQSAVGTPNTSSDFSAIKYPGTNTGSTNMPVEIPKLSGKNYLNWKSIMTDIIALRGFEEAVFGRSTDATKNLLAKILIKSSLDEAHLAEIRDHNSPKDIWDHLSRICMGANSSDIALLARTFYNYSYNIGDTISTHFEKLSTMRQQLKEANQYPSDEVFIDRILQTLPTEYTRLKENWDYLHSEDKTIMNLKLRALKIEDDLKKQEIKPEKQAFMVSNDSNKREDINDRKKRTHCAKCGHKGHWAKECKTKKENYLKNIKNNHNKDQNKDHQANKDKTNEEKPKVVFMVQKVMPSEALTHKEIQISQQVYNYVSLHNQPLKNLWIADSGATDHICNNESWFSELKKYDSPKTVKVGDNGSTLVLGVGSINIISNTGTSTIEARIENVLLVPGLTANLLSVGQLGERNIETRFTKKEATFILNEEVVARGNKLATNLYLMDIHATNLQTDMALFCQTKRSLSDWHNTLGHASVERIEKLIQDKSLNISATNKGENIDCPTCPPGKGKHVNHPSVGIRATEIGDRVHVDLAGPVDTSLHGYKYFMVCKDEATSFTYLYCIQDKSSVNIALAKLLTEFEVQTNHAIKRIHTDQGSEFVNSKTELLFSIEHVIHEVSATYTPQQNGRVEREVQSITNMARTMLIGSSLPKNLWDEAVKTACFLLNRLPNKNSTITPFELAIKQKPRISHLCEFGRQCHVIIDGHHLTKFDPRTQQGFIVGFTRRTNTYRVLLQESNRVIESCNIIFKPHKTQQPEINIGRNNMNKSSTIICHDTPPDQSNLSQYFDQLLNDIRQDPEVIMSTPESNNTSIASPDFSPITVHGSPGIENQRNHEAYITSLPSAAPELEPQNYHDAIRSNDNDNWLDAIKQELDAHESNGTWIVVDKPHDKKPLTAKWVFKLKTKTDGSVERYKARLVVRGFQQKAGQDYFETFAPVARYESVRALIAIAAQQELLISQFDVVTAFLNGQLEEEIYVSPPEGMDIGPNKVLKLIKGLYGLKQAPRIWNCRFKKEIEGLGFEATQSDNCIFKHQDRLIFICLYVDDGLVIAKDPEDLEKVIHQLKLIFKVRSIPETTFIGLEIRQVNNGYTISQGAYTRRIIERFGGHESQNITSPLLTGHNLLVDDDDEPHQCPYREAIGALIYLATNSRPDILHPVTMLAKFCNLPKKKHWDAVMRIFKYLNNTTNLGLKFIKTEEAQLIAYSDADWASDTSTRKSITGTLILLAGGPVVFRSQQQSLIAQSTTEAEFIAASETIRDLVWLNSLTMELGVRLSKPALNCDSQTAIRLIQNPEFPRRTKHIDIKYHLIRQHYSSKLFDLRYCHTSHQLADFLTKILPRQQFVNLIESANITSCV